MKPATYDRQNETEFSIYAANILSWINAALNREFHDMANT